MAEGVNEVPRPIAAGQRGFKLFSGVRSEPLGTAPNELGCPLRGVEATSGSVESTCTIGQCMPGASGSNSTKGRVLGHMSCSVTYNILRHIWSRS
ncbi:hypothetical protein FKM82_020194 [Ascaphus truei]